MPARTAKPIAALALTGIGTALVVGFRVPGATVATPPTAATTTTTSSPTTVATTSDSTGAAATAGAATAGASAATGTTTGSGSGATTAVASTAQYADGTWTGTAVSEPWGTFQVQAVVSGGQLTDVVILSAPQDGHSSRINSQAVPILTQAAIAAQGASVDMVSGATWTSQSYSTSLQGALDQAKAAAEKAA